MRSPAVALSAPDAHTAEGAAKEAEAVAEYPSLSKYMDTGSTSRYYDALMAEVSKHLPTAEKDESGRAWVFFSMRYFASIHGLNIVTASRNIAMFALFGLIVKASSLAYTRNDYPQFMREGFDRHQTNDEFGITWYHVPAYTPALLAEADRLAHIWHTSGYSRKAISKATLIRVYGFALADRAYGKNAVRISSARMQTERAIEDHVLDAIKRDGYVIGKEMEAAYGDVWLGLRPDLIQRYALIYGRPSLEEKRRFHLLDNRWIIRPP